MWQVVRVCMYICTTVFVTFVAIGIYLKAICGYYRGVAGASTSHLPSVLGPPSHQFFLVNLPPTNFLGIRLPPPCPTPPSLLFYITYNACVFKSVKLYV